MWSRLFWNRKAKARRQIHFQNQFPCVPLDVEISNRRWCICYQRVGFSEIKTASQSFVLFSVELPQSISSRANFDLTTSLHVIDWTPNSTFLTTSALHCSFPGNQVFSCACCFRFIFGKCHSSILQPLLHSSDCFEIVQLNNWWDTLQPQSISVTYFLALISNWKVKDIIIHDMLQGCIQHSILWDIYQNKGHLMCIARVVPELYFSEIDLDDCIQVSKCNDHHQKYPHHNA